jgi:2-polyprenyl-3-methyl-5-hydroxy-6-metoxy-1,4-benzoquinol methylase
MIDLERRKKILKYLAGIYPSVWQLPNSVKILEFRALIDDHHPVKGETVLDLGCGKGLQTQLLASKGASVIGIDPSIKRHKAAITEIRWSRVKKNVDFRCCTLEVDSLESSSLDKAISFCVLEHIPNLDDVLSTIHKGLKPGGELHATVDSLSNIGDEQLLDKHRNEHAVVQYFTLETIEETLNRAGFSVFEKRHILTSDLARQKLMDELNTGNYFQPARIRKSDFEKLLSEEVASSSPDIGTMILVRARKA